MIEIETLLTAKGEMSDRVTGLDAGSDGYIVKLSLAPLALTHQGFKDTVGEFKSLAHS